jgi:hypothetical protein
MKNDRWWERAELLGARLTWLVRMEWAARVLYLAPQQVEAADPATGETVTWRPGVEDFAWEESIDLFALTPANRSLTLVVRPFWLDVPSLIADGQDLHQCTVQVYRHIIGGRALLYFSGRVRDYSFGPRGAPVELAIDANPWDEAGDLCVEDARVDANTWPKMAEKTNGEKYPIVIGQPGLISEDESVQAVPAYAVDRDEKYILIAGHAVQASQVELHQNGASAVGPVEHVVDGLGRLVAVADVHNHFGGVTYHEDETYRTAWTEGPGLVREGGVAIRTAGEAIRWATQQSTAPWDPASVEVAAQKLESYAIDTSIVCSPTSPLTPWDWLTAQILPLLPVSVIGTARGIGLHVWPTDEEPVATITRGKQGVHRVGRVESQDRTRLITSSALRYAYDADHNLYSERVAAVARPEDEANGGGVHRSLEAGLARYGPGVAEASTTDAVYSAATAGAVVNWRAQLFGLPAWSVAYELEKAWGWLRLGDQVRITDAEIGWSAELAVIQAVRHQPGGRLLVTLRVQSSAS